MSQADTISEFNRELDRVLAGEEPADSLTQTDQTALRLAGRIARVDFSPKNSIRTDLRLQIIQEQRMNSHTATTRLSSWMTSFYQPVSLTLHAKIAFLLLLIVASAFIYPTKQPEISPAQSLALFPGAQHAIANNAPDSMNTPLPIPTPLAPPSNNPDQHEQAISIKITTTTSEMTDQQAITPIPLPRP
jgi:hypothetical protein